MYLSLDLGSTNFKAAIFSTELRCLGRSEVQISHLFGDAGEVELPCERVMPWVCEAIRGAIADAGCDPTDLDAMAIASQAQTFTLCDADGKPLIPMRSWQDRRAAGQVTKLAADLPDFRQHCSFSVPFPGLQITHLHQIAVMQPALLRESRVVSLPSFIVKMLAGNDVIDDNQAAMTGLYSLVTRGWWPMALASCGLHEEQLPQLVTAGALAGRVTPSGAATSGLPVRLPVILAGNDQSAASVGAELGPGDLLLTLGTAQTAYRWQASLPEPSDGVIRGYFPSGSYAMAADRVGGNLINWAKTVIAGAGTDDAFFALAGAVNDSAGLRFHADLPLQSGRWEGIGLHHGPPHFARSLLESLVARLAEHARRIGLPPAAQPVLATGGGSSSPLWCSLLAQALDRKVQVVAADPLLGAARLGRHVATTS